MADKLLLPRNPQAEGAVLACMLHSPKEAAWGLKHLREADFDDPGHRLIYRAIADLVREGTTAHFASVIARLIAEDHLDEAQGESYIQALLNTYALPGYASVYAVDMLKATNARRLAEVGQRIVNRAYDGDGDLGAALDDLTELQKDRAAAGAEPLSERRDSYDTWLQAKLNKERGVHGPRLGLDGIDWQTRGFSDECLVVVKAQEKYGKTTLLRQSLLETARWCKVQNPPEWVLLYLLEGSPYEWLNGAASFLGGASWQSFRVGADQGEASTSDEEQRARYRGINDLFMLPVLLSEGTSEIGEIQADVAWHLAEGRKVCAVYVDHAQEVEAPGQGHEWMMNVANGLLQINRRHGVPVIVASQITVQEGGDKRTRWGPELEQKASSVWQIERGKQKDQDEARREARGRILNTHRRNGPQLKPLDVVFEQQTARITDPEHQEAQRGREPVREHDQG